MANVIQRIASRALRLATRAVEGQYRPGPYLLPVSGGILDDGGSWNWWQKGGYITGYSPSALVEACVQAYAQTCAMCAGDHWVLDEKTGGRTRVTTSSLSRVLRKPNAYQSSSDFMVDLVTDVYMEGNAYALALRNSRFEIVELHLMEPRQCRGRISPETGDIFYSLGGNPVVDYQVNMHPLLVPGRDVLHVRLNTSPYNMLLGESPLLAAARDVAAGDAIMQQQLNFYLNQARPSMVLTTDLQLDKDQVQALRDRWNEQSRGLNAGGTPILTAGIKPQVLSTTPNDSQLADVLKLSQQNIALAFRVPLQILGIGGTPLGSTEALMQSWIASGLGFCLNHIEEAFGNLFDLWGPPDEYVEFNTDALLRSLTKDRVETAARGVQGGIFSPNEARADFGLPKVAFGDEPRVQQQVVPLSAAEGIPSAPPAPSANAAPPAPRETANNEDTAKFARSLISTSFEYDRREQLSRRSA